MMQILHSTGAAYTPGRDACSHTAMLHNGGHKIFGVLAIVRDLMLAGF